jgi:hypothetical protein
MSSQVGRTIPSFRIACIAEELKWRSFRSYLDKDDRKKFDEMFSVSRQHNSARSNSARPIIIHSTIMAIILHQYKQLMGLMKKNAIILYQKNRINQAKTDNKT